MTATLKRSVTTGFRLLNKQFSITALILLICTYSLSITGCTYTSATQELSEQSQETLRENPAKPRAVIPEEKPVRVPMTTE